MVVVAADGRVEHVARRPTPIEHLPGGGAIHPPDALLAAVEDLLREGVEAADGGASTGGQICAIGIAGMAEAGLGLDASSAPVSPIFAWFDARPARHAEALARDPGAAALFDRTGLRIDAKHPLARLAWLRDEAPDVHRRLERWVGVPDFAALHLTGAFVTAPSLACRTLLYDLRAGAWDPELVALGGIGVEALPAVLQLGESAGALRPEVALRVGLPDGIPVTIAGHDHVVGAFGAGVVEPGAALDSLGTAEATILVTAAPRLSEAVQAAGFSVGVHVAPARHYLIGGLQAGGAMVDWLMERLLGVGAADVRSLLPSSPAGPTGIIVRPWLRGRPAPWPEPDGTASIEGLRLEHGQSDLVRATLEGIAYQARAMIEALEGLVDAPIERLRLAGGGLAVPGVAELRAAVDPWPVDRATTEETVAFGAALAGGMAAGVYGSVAEALAVVPDPLPIARPDEEVVAAYDRVYRERFLAGVATG